MKNLKYFIILTSLFSFTCSINLIFTQSDAQRDVTADIVPQGTSLNATNTTNTLQESNAGDIASDVIPQGTSLESNSSNVTTQEDTTKNTSADVVPQGTSLK